ncbi:MAG: 4Fe-4S dicluster domain-containing protein [Bacteroidia bacterium]|nr:4Fe-4S dicluster domain-containing protein [Bacteroidia bacterium]
MNSYFGEIKNAAATLWDGLKVTFPHLINLGRVKQERNIDTKNYFQDTNLAVTVRYPLENIPVPDNGRYRLHMEADDCIVCDKCARICPVDCITIEGIKAGETLGVTSDGSKKRIHLPVFDIDMAKCCFCGLCTTVCPTECLTMTKVYDYSETDRDNLIYHFGLLSPDEAQKLKEKKSE